MTLITWSCHGCQGPKIEELDELDPWWHEQKLKGQSIESDVVVPPADNNEKDTSMMDTDSSGEGSYFASANIEELPDPVSPLTPTEIGEQFVSLYYRIWSRIYSIGSDEISISYQRKLLGLFAPDIICSCNGQHAHGSHNALELLMTTLCAIRAPTIYPCSTAPFVSQLEFVPSGVSTASAHVGTPMVHMLVTGKIWRRFLEPRWRSTQQPSSSYHPEELLHALASSAVIERTECVGWFSNVLLLVFSPLSFSFLLSNSLLRFSLNKDCGCNTCIVEYAKVL